MTTDSRGPASDYTAGPVQAPCSHITSHQSPVTGHQSLVTSHWSPVTGHQLPVIRHQSVGQHSYRRARHTEGVVLLPGVSYAEPPSRGRVRPAGPPSQLPTNGGGGDPAGYSHGTAADLWGIQGQIDKKKIESEYLKLGL